MKTFTKQEFEHILDEDEIDEASRKVMQKWFDRGDACAVYRNELLGHPELGHRQFVSYGSPKAQLEISQAEDLPGFLPDIGNTINWRYCLEGVYRA